MRNKIFVVKEVESGRFLSNQSIGKWDKAGKTWSYCTFPLHCTGIRYYPSAEHAAMIMDNLKSKLTAIGLGDRELEVIEVDMEKVSTIEFCDSDKQITHINLSDARYNIFDENGNYVDGNSIMKVKNEYSYFTYSNVSDGCVSYTKRDRALKALANLELHNGFGNLNHSFRIICEGAVICAE